MFYIVNVFPDGFTLFCCGLITGIIVSALGFGGLVFTPIAKSLISTTGVMSTFKWFAIIFVVVTFVGALFIKNPPAGYKPEGWTPPVKKAGAAHVQDFTPRQVLKTPQFYMITITLMFASAAGLMVIPFSKMLGISGGLPDAVAISGVMVISGFNSFGRLFWGWASDAHSFICGSVTYFPSDTATDIVNSTCPSSPIVPGDYRIPLPFPYAAR